MLTISKPLSSGQAQSYHKLEFTSEAQSYYKQGDAVKGEWQGKLAARLGLAGEVSPLGVLALGGGHSPADRRTDGPAPRRHGVQEPRREHDQGRRTPRRLGCHVFRPEVRLADRSCRRRRARARRAPRRRHDRAWTSWSGTRRPGSAATIRPKRRANSSPRSSSTTRPAPWTAMPRRSSTPMPSSSMSPSGTNGTDPCASGARLLRVPAVCDGRVSV